jgi:hypothetical protein
MSLYGVGLYLLRFNPKCKTGPEGVSLVSTQEAGRNIEEVVPGRSMQRRGRSGF